MGIPRDWPAKPPIHPVVGVARFQARCQCGANNWQAVDCGDGIGWECVDCGVEDTDHPRVGLPEGDRTEEDL